MGRQAVAEDALKPEYRPRATCPCGDGPRPGHPSGWCGQGYQQRESERLGGTLGTAYISSSLPEPQRSVEARGSAAMSLLRQHVEEAQGLRDAAGELARRLVGFEPGQGVGSGGPVPAEVGVVGELRDLNDSLAEALGRTNAALSAVLNAFG